VVSTRITSPIGRVIEGAFNQGNLAPLNHLYDPDYVSNPAKGGVSKGLQGLEWLVITFRTAFRDLQCTIVDEFRGEDRYAAHWMISGTHAGLFFGNQPTGKPFKVPGIIFARIKDSRIVEDWTLVDLMGILQQLGIIPPLKG
jgi:predicted ester cyclase